MEEVPKVGRSQKGSPLVLLSRGTLKSHSVSSGPATRLSFPPDAPSCLSLSTTLTEDRGRPDRDGPCNPKWVGWSPPSSPHLPISPAPQLPSSPSPHLSRGRYRSNIVQYRSAHVRDDNGNKEFLLRTARYPLVKVTIRINTYSFTNATHGLSVRRKGRTLRGRRSKEGTHTRVIEVFVNNYDLLIST